MWAERAPNSGSRPVLSVSFKWAMTSPRGFPMEPAVARLQSRTSLDSHYRDTRKNLSQNHLDGLSDRIRVLEAAKRVAVTEGRVADQERNVIGPTQTEFTLLSCQTGSQGGPDLS